MLSICLNRDTISYSSILSTCKQSPEKAEWIGQCVLVDKIRRFDILVNRDWRHILWLITHFKLSIYDINFVCNWGFS